jgi:hypothetical protein
MIAQLYRTTPILSLPAPRTAPSEDDAAIEAQIDSYLNGDDLRVASHSALLPTKINVDDVTLMRSAREIAGYIREMEACETPGTSRLLRTQRVVGFAFLYLIKAYDGAALPSYAAEHIEILGDFKELITEFFIRRVHHEPTLSLYERMRGPQWTDEVQAALLHCVERLWGVGLATGMTYSDRDRAQLAEMLAPMADHYTLVSFGKINPLRVDVLNAEHIISKLCTFTMRHLARR